MKKLHAVYTMIIIAVLAITSCKKAVEEKTETTAQKSEIVASDKEIQVIQFHSENRCMTCNKIEALTLETLKSYPELHFQLINVDDAKNEKIAEQFEATGTALFLYNPATQNKMDLTEFAFMTAGNEAQFEEDLKKEIDQFLK